MTTSRSNLNNGLNRSCFTNIIFKEYNMCCWFLCFRNVLRIPGFNLDLETNTRLSRTSFYVADNINYTRKLTLEGVDSNLIIIDIEGSNPTRIINVYRSFNPQNVQSQREKFKYQLYLIKEAFYKRTVLLGDFNLDYFMKNNVN